MGVPRFENIIGHTGVIDRLKRDLAGGRLAHAYLFAGPSGIGKAAVARLFGAATLCKSPDIDDRPCGQCLACGKIERSNHPDFFVMAPLGGKRWIRIDQVRELQAALALRPFESGRRVVIIDGAENMNEAAQSAFLKTLEEPPPNTLIVLVAPGAHRLLPTIVSRCRIERFGPLKTRELASILTQRRNLDEVEASLVAGLASGSVGAAMVMDLDIVRRVRPALIVRIADIATDKNRNPEKIMGLVNQLIALGEDSLSLIRVLLKDVASKKLSRSSIINSDQDDIIDRLEKRWSLADIVSLFEKTLEAEEGLARNLQKSLLFENLLFSIAQEESG